MPSKLTLSFSGGHLDLNERTCTAENPQTRLLFGFNFPKLFASCLFELLHLPSYCYSFLAALYISMQYGQSMCIQANFLTVLPINAGCGLHFSIYIDNAVSQALCHLCCACLTSSSGASREACPLLPTMWTISGLG